ncbi:PepSY domain-containing protein [Dokdonella sp. MW10]|uniref:PepSY domain-containing protein n=1 Tax=Dokdonella sp. MW10 TaxID=2992926 RepID=UPI003F7D2C33
MTSQRCFRVIASAIAITAALACSGVSASEVSAQQAVDKVQRDTNGKVLSVQTLQIGKRKIYRIKVLTGDGRVKVVEVKAND